LPGNACEARTGAFFLLGVIASVLLSDVSSAQQPWSCAGPQGSGACLPWGETRVVVDGYITAISADGSVVVGTTTSNMQAWRFKRGEPIKFLSISGATKVIPGYEPRLNMNHEAREVQTISANGSKVVGMAKLADGSKRAFYWNADSSTDNDFILLPAGPAPNALQIIGPGAGTPPPAATWTVTPEAPMISADGQVVVGLGRARRLVGGNQTGGASEWPFLWTAANGTSDSPNAPFPYQIYIQGMSGDGSTIIAQTDSAPGLLPHPVANKNGVLVEIHPEVGRPTAVSHDGNEIWGTLSLGSNAFPTYRWRNGVITQFPITPPFVFLATSLNDSGTSVVGTRKNFPFGTLETVWNFGLVNGSDGLGTSIFNIVGDVGVSMESPLSPNPVVIPYARTDRAGTTFVIDGTRSIARVPPLQYAALGDSYSSGEGVRITAPGANGGWLPGTDVADVNECHRSVIAYSRLLSPPASSLTFLELGTPASPIPGSSFQFNACSGAETKHIYDESQWLSQLPQASALNADHDLITITIGGNDAYFDDVLTSCIFNGSCFFSSVPDMGTTTWWPFLDDHIRGPVRNRLVEVFSRLKVSAPDATIIAISYPRLFPAENGDDCPGGGWGNSAVALGLSGVEKDYLNHMAAVMNGVISSAARQVGIHYVDITNLFMGHEVCSASPWINAVTRPKVFSFHPTATGQRQIARKVDRFLGEKGIDYEFGFYESGLPRNPPPGGL